MTKMKKSVFLSENDHRHKGKIHKKRKAEQLN